MDCAIEELREVYLRSKREMAIRSIFTFIRREWFLGFSFGTAVTFLLLGNDFLAWLPNLFGRLFVFFWLFTAIMGSALAVVRHADHLATRLGEPFGTLILTLSSRLSRWPASPPSCCTALIIPRWRATRFLRW